MSAFIIAALTADGFIARNETHFADWSSKEDKRRFVELTKRAGVVVMGSRTFETIGKALPGRLNIVYTRSGKKYAGTETTNLPPPELLRGLETRGYKEVAICGGATIYTLFMRSGVVNKLYLTVEPLMFGAGVRLFNEPIDVTLDLVSSKKTLGGAVFLEYRVPPTHLKASNTKP